MLLHAFAKVNLGLRVLGKRPDGYHELRTVFQSIDWCDDIRIESSERFQFSASEGPQDESNLVVRAVRAFESVSGLKRTCLNSLEEEYSIRRRTRGWKC